MDNQDQRNWGTHMESGRYLFFFIFRFSSSRACFLAKHPTAYVSLKACTGGYCCINSRCQFLFECNKPNTSSFKSGNCFHCGEPPLKVFLFLHFLVFPNFLFRFYVMQEELFSYLKKKLMLLLFFLLGTKAITFVLLNTALHPSQKKFLNPFKERKLEQNLLRFALKSQWMY